LAVIGIAGGELDIESLTLVIDHQIELEAKEPINQGFAPSSQASKRLLASIPTVMAHLQSAQVGLFVGREQA